MGRLTFDGLFCDIAKCKETPGGTFCENGSCSQRKVWERLKEYEDMEEQGRLVVLPCKVGDTVYHFCDEFGCILPYFVETFNVGFLDKDRNYWRWEANSHAEETDELLDELDFDLDDIGKTVFLTREEAQRTLEGANGDG